MFFSMVTFHHNSQAQLPCVCDSVLCVVRMIAVGNKAYLAVGRIQYHPFEV